MKPEFLLILLMCSGICSHAQNIPADPIVYQTPEMGKVVVKENVPFRKVNDTSITLDVYYPPAFNFETKLPVVIFINGIGSLTIPKWRVYKDWAKLIASKGMIAVNYQTRENNGRADGEALFEYLRAHGTAMSIDTARMAIWTCSANARVGMRLAMQAHRNYIKSLVVYYGPPDSLGKLRQDLPTLVVRCGLDAQFINTGIENFMQQALSQDMRIEMINYVKGTHAFDVAVNTDESRFIIDKTINFFKDNFKLPYTNPGEFVLTNRNFMWLMTHEQPGEPISEFRKARDRYRADSNFKPYWNAVIREDVLNTNAYWLMQHNHVRSALEAFKLMVETYPESPNAYDGLADAYEALGNKAEAVQAAQTCLRKLDTDTNMNAQAKDRIRKSAQAKLERLK